MNQTTDWDEEICREYEKWLDQLEMDLTDSEYGRHDGPEDVY